MPSTCDSCTGASRRLRPLERLGRPGEASRGGGGRGRARACQRVPGVIYDVRPMSLSAGLLGAGCGRQLDRQAGLPPGPPSPLPIPLAPALRLGPRPPGGGLLCLPSSLCHSLPFYLSVFLPFLVSMSLHTHGLCLCRLQPSLDRALSCPSAFPWPSPISLALPMSPPLLVSIFPSLSVSPTLSH